jgi:response regulator RpfG family c-di-GMP phosphodiesterase
MNQIRILCVDDERNVLRALERIFLDDDYQILTACSGEEGLQLLQAAPRVQVVISDYRMPGMNGVEFLKEVFRKHPQTIRIVLSGYADTASVVAAINEGQIYKFIPKPWNDDELRMTVVQALESFLIKQKNEELAEELRVKNGELRDLNANLERLVYERTSQLSRQNEALLYATDVLNHLPVGVLALAEDGSVLQINREAAQLLGVAPHQVLGKAGWLELPAEVAELAQQVSCGIRMVRVMERELQVQVSTLREGEQPGALLTITRG